MATKMKIKKGDLVQILTGKDRGKQGRVLEARPRERRVVVENLNVVKRHMRPRPIRDASRMGGQQIAPGGIIDRPAPLPVSNVMVVCPVCKLPTRVGIKEKEVKGEIVRVRVCKRDGCRRGDRPVSARRDLHPAPEGSLRARAAPQLKDELGRARSWQVPRVAKITLNMGVGDAKTDAKALDAAIEELTTIAGQRAQVRTASKSIASFKLREGMAVGAKVTLRGAYMYEFLDRLVSIALPRIRDFRGLNPDSFDGRGNYSIGIREQIIFPEIDYDSVAVDPGAGRRHHHHGEDGRRGARAAARARAPLRDREKGQLAHGQDLATRQAEPPAAVQGARVHALPALRPPACGLPQVRALPHLPAGARPPGRDPRHDEVELVGETTC